ncbi:SH2 domain containing protein 7 [Dissostichus eleginoides]|uniref:SH2 domain containing protein 7 n=1 Tax=Dissostichus eleginoides TaxID=100907 RepID=A0AAD9BUY8_DISEL|nr:SH2 domain containing protein 7 [Dissostichus eleginoides]
MSGVELNSETSEGGLKELVLRWFTETQAPLILNNGNFPDWFQGFVARKDTEDLLRDKAQGCFLIRLSDKAIGYILSYKGHDRCRHFVITQNQDGQFVIAGDCQTYKSLTELMEHFKVSPIQPFGEYLTTSFYEVDSGELYDVKQDDHSGPGNNRRTQQQNDPPTPALPLKPKNRKLTGVVSVDTVSLSQGVPPVPKRGIPLGFSLRGSFPETTSHPSETYAEPNRSERLRGNTNQVSDRDSFNTSNMSYQGDLSPPGITYSELTHKVTCHTYSLHSPRDSPRASSSMSEQQGGGLEMLKSNPLYEISGGPGGDSALQGDPMYAEVPQKLPDDTYEQIPGEAAIAQCNMYESLEELKTKKSKSTWGKNNIVWKKFFPENKK